MITQNKIYLPDFQALIVADSVPLFPDLDKQSRFPASFTYITLKSPPVINKGIRVPSDDKPQRRLDQFSIEPVTASGDSCLVSSAPPQSESSKAPSTNSAFKLPEEIEADIDQMTVLKEAKELLQCARKCKAPPDKIRKLKSKFNNTKRRVRRSVFFKELEAKLSKEQIAQIKHKSNKCTPDKKEEYEFVMGHIEKHADKQLTRKYPSKVLCAAIVYGQNIAFDSIEQRDLFLKCKKWASKALHGYSYRKRDAEYIRLLKLANTRTTNGMGISDLLH